MPQVEEKVRELRSAIDIQEESGGKTPILMIDGGIKHHNAAIVRDWGIDIAVVGSGLINETGSISQNLEEIQKALEGDQSTH